MRELRGGALVPSVSPVLYQDSACATLGLLGASAWLKLWTSLASAGRIDPKLSRKIVHTGSAPLFLLTWPFFSSNDAPTRVIASLVPLVFMGRLVSAARGAKSQTSLVTAISRTGDKGEALGGPFLYCIVLVLLTLFSWRSDVAVVAIIQMAVGDGFADIFGRRWGKTKWPWSSDKSVVGTVSFILGSFLVCLGVFKWFGLFGCTLGRLSHLPLVELSTSLLTISVISALTELVPVGDDNLTVPAVAAFSTFLLGR